MANSDTHQVTESWAAVKANGSDITDGIFTILNQEAEKIACKISDVLPTQQRGDFNISTETDGFKMTLSATEKLYTKVSKGTADIGVMTG